HAGDGLGRVYEARVLGVPDERDLARLRRGIALEGRPTGPAEVRLLEGNHHLRTSRRTARVDAGARGLPVRGGAAPRATGRDRSRPATATLLITVREGRNRQVRKM